MAEKEIIRSFYYTGGSMMPQFSEGDFLLSEAVEDISNIEIGDVIVFKAAGKNIVHRVVEVTEEGQIKTQGDNNSEPDKNILAFEDVIGKVSNAGRPERIEKHIVYNQHSKASREMAAEIMAKNEKELNNLNIVLEEAQNNLENSKAHQDYVNCKEQEDFIRALADYEEEKITEEEVKIFQKTLEETEAFKNYFQSEEYRNYERALTNLRGFDPVRIHTDSCEIREKFQNLSAFPTAMMDIPEYVSENGKNSKEVKVLRKVQSVRELEGWEAGHVNNIKAIIGMEKVKIFPSKEKGKVGKS